MAKYYVQCGRRKMVLAAEDARAAAEKAFFRLCDGRPQSLLGEGILVSERGFGRGEAARISTFEMLAEIDNVAPEQILAEALAQIGGRK